MRRRRALLAVTVRAPQPRSGLPALLALIPKPTGWNRDGRHIVLGLGRVGEGGCPGGGARAGGGNGQPWHRASGRGDRGGDQQARAEAGGAAGWTPGARCQVGMVACSAPLRWLSPCWQLATNLAARMVRAHRSRRPLPNCNPPQHHAPAACSAVRFVDAVVQETVAWDKQVHPLPPAPWIGACTPHAVPEPGHAAERAEGARGAAVFAVAEMAAGGQAATANRAASLVGVLGRTSLEQAAAALASAAGLIEGGEEALLLAAEEVRGHARQGQMLEGTGLHGFLGSGCAAGALTSQRRRGSFPERALVPLRPCPAPQNNDRKRTGAGRQQRRGGG